MADNDDSKHDHTGAVVFGGLVVAGGAITALILLNRSKPIAVNLCPGANLIIEDSASGALVLVDSTKVIHPISAAGVAACKYCTDSTHKYTVDDATFKTILATCTVGPPVPDAGPCPAGPVCSPPGDPWVTWWQSHHPGDGARESVSIYYDLLGHPPVFNGDSTYPYGIWLIEAAGQGCGAYGMSPLQGISFRIISDSACEFFSKIDKAAGGSASMGCNGSFPSLCGGCSCAFLGKCSPVAWLTAAGAQVLGHPFTPTSSDFTTYWISGARLCNTLVSAWMNATQHVLINSTDFANRIAAQAASATPPWGTTVAAADVFVPSALHAADFVPSTLHAGALAGGARLGPGSGTPFALESASGII